MKSQPKWFYLCTNETLKQEFSVLFWIAQRLSYHPPISIPLFPPIMTSLFFALTDSDQRSIWPMRLDVRVSSAPAKEQPVPISGPHHMKPVRANITNLAKGCINNSLLSHEWHRVVYMSRSNSLLPQFNFIPAAAVSVTS